MDGAHLPGIYNFDVPQPISTDLALYGGIFAKRHTIPKAGTYIPQHAHGYPHLSILTVGAMRAWQDGDLVGDFFAPAEIRIPAHAKHTFLALADGTTFYCIHNAEQFDVEEEHALPGGQLRAVGLPKDDGVVFAREGLDMFLQEDSPLYYAHAASVGEMPDAWKDKNWALMKRLQDLGVLHMTTARYHGRLIGYLMALVAPTLHEIGETEGMHTIFYTSPEFPGLQLRLQRASMEYLRSLGVGHVVLRAGPRGNGPRLPALYRRLGAVPSGQLFMVDLKEAPGGD